MNWYVVQAYSGYEMKVRDALIERINLAGLKEKFGEILVPTEQVVELKSGEKKKTERKFFPGYIIIEMDMDDDTWQLVKHTPRISTFVGGTKEKPMPISKEEVDKNGKVQEIEYPTLDEKWLTTIPRSEVVDKFPDLPEQVLRILNRIYNSIPELVKTIHNHPSNRNFYLPNTNKNVIACLNNQNEIEYNDYNDVCQQILQDNVERLDELFNELETEVNK